MKLNNEEAYMMKKSFYNLMMLIAVAALVLTACAN